MKNRTVAGLVLSVIFTGLLYPGFRAEAVGPDAGKRSAAVVAAVPAAVRQSPVDADEVSQPVSLPPVIMVAPGLFRLGEVTIDKNRREVSFPARVNMVEGLLEYLVVSNRGKLHESLLATDVDPIRLQVALLLLGLEGGMIDLSSRTHPFPLRGDPVHIKLSWSSTDGKQYRECPIETWVENRNVNAVMEPIEWIFSGSVVENGAFLGQVDGSIIAVYSDPLALINNPLPDGRNDDIWFVNREQVPPLGTPVAVRITGVAKTSEK